MPQPPSFAGPTRRRPGSSVGVRVLPAAGRVGPVPEWPLTRPTRRELVVWAGLWGKPQAVVWEEQDQRTAVARYARLLVRAEARTAPAALQGQVTAMEDRLGLTPKAMRLLLWVIADPATEAAAPAAGEEAATGTDGPRRLRAVE